jgi:para-nitrobenzyl esterase
MVASPAIGAKSSTSTTTTTTLDGVLATPAEATVRTSAGMVRGFRRSGVYIFKGIPYGADTSGAARFLPPEPAPSWEGTRLTLAYGPVCPQPAQTHASEEMNFVNDWSAGYEREDCLRVNVWSPALGAAAKLPVMVWFHGGGYTSGSSQELPVYDGENLARHGVVMVSVNHRLGPLGFLDLSGIGGEAFADSGNVGMLDLVLALQWVRDNGAAFGGDVSRVTIFGHSGGGGKVSTLMGMPAAKGLFQRAIVMSGSIPNTTTSATAQSLAEATVSELGLAPGDTAALQRIEPSRLIDAGFKASRKVTAAAREAKGGGAPGPFGIQFGPVIDTPAVPQSWLGAAPRLGADVPMIVGNVRDEFRPLTLHVDDTQLRDAIPPPHREQAPEIIAGLRKAYPELPPTELAAIIGAIGMRNMAVDQALMQASTGAPVYNYWFTWTTPILDGRIGCPHGMDLPFAFDNTARCDQFTGNTPAARKLARTMNRAFVNFAATGDPSQPGLAWPRFDSARLATMVFNNSVRIEDDPIGAVRRALA